MSGHTKGPWKVSDDFGDTRIIGKRNGRPAHIVTGMYDEENEPTLDELAANAALIASAPELLAALGHIYDYSAKQFGENTEERALWAQVNKIVSGAIAKAEGR
jgi:hypothetical protein